jgi:uncharacterized cupin superfamily protein
VTVREIAGHAPTETSERSNSTQKTKWLPAGAVWRCIGISPPAARDAMSIAAVLRAGGNRSMTKPSGFDPLSLPESNATRYPEPYRSTAKKRWNRRLGDHSGLKNFGVNITRIEPGGQSSQRHWHLLEDEFVYVLEGEAVLVTDAGEEVLAAGMCAGFPAGAENGHHFLNRSDRDVLLLVVGDRKPGEEAFYPDIDMHGGDGPDGRFIFTRKDGTPY